jgi:hypothetical protein
MRSRFSIHSLFVLCLSIIIWMLGPLLSSSPDVQAQTTAPLDIFNVNLDHFPEITLDTRLSREVFSSFPVLSPHQVQVTEEGNNIIPTSINKVEPGVQTILALNLGGYMAMEYRQKTLFLLFQQHILDWLDQQPGTGRDDYSFTSNSGNILSHVTEPQILTQSLANFEPNLYATTSSLQALSSALSLAGDSLPRETMQRTLLYVTVLPDQVAYQTLSPLITQASQLGVKVFVLLIAPPDSINTALALPLMNLASKTGGSFTVFSGREELPDLQDEMEYLRSYYEIDYSSLIRKSGEYETVIKLVKEAKEWVSLPRSFQIELLSPDVYFFSPATSIHLFWKYNPSTKVWNLAPSSVPFDLKVEFPDQHTRSIHWLGLRVDGVVLQELTHEPFNIVTWDLSSVSQSRNYLLQVQGEDSFGFEFQTTKIPVEVLVDPPPKSFLTKVVEYFSSGSAVVLLAVLIIFSALWVHKKNAIRKAQKLAAQADASLPSSGLFVLQPVKTSVPSPVSASISTPSKKQPEKALARLVRLNEVTREEIPENDLSIKEKNVTLGSDPRIVTLEISSSTVSPVHARVQLTPSGAFLINDQNSAAGTWVNFSPVSSQGTYLENGDLVHIGKVLYRFEILNNPPRED